MRFSLFAGAALVFACALPLVPHNANAQVAFTAKNYAECLMLYAKKAQSDSGSVLMRKACRCLFQEQAPADCAQYSPQALDCFLRNVMNVQEDAKVDGIKRSCESQFPVK